MDLPTTIILLVIYFILLPVSLVLAAQPLIRNFQLVDYKYPELLLGLKNNVQYKQKQMQPWRTAVYLFSVLLVIIVLIQIAGSLKEPIIQFSDGVSLIFSLAAMVSHLLVMVAVGLLLAITFTVHLVIWNTKTTRMKTDKNLWLGIALFFVVVVEQIACAAGLFTLWFALLRPLYLWIFGFASNSIHGDAWLICLNTGTMAVVGIISLSMQYATVKMLPRLLALASMAVRPLEKALAGRK